jgi:RecG-like helicase
MDLQAPITALKGVGDRRARAYAKLGITTVEQLLHHFPRQYVDWSAVTPIAQAPLGELYVYYEQAENQAVKLTKADRAALQSYAEGGF